MKKGLRTGFVLTAALMLAASGLAACDNGGDGHEHVYEWSTDTAATCVLAGTEKGVCSICGDVDYRSVSALGHIGESTEITLATCETDGVLQIKCSRCGETSEEAIPALGHDFAKYTVVTPATFESTGLERAKCSRCDEIDERVISKLDENTPIEYQFRIVRTNGSTMSASSMKISVYRTDGSLVTEGKPSQGVFRAKLMPQTYTVKVSGAPDGYSAKDSYTVTSGDPVCIIVLTAAPIKGTIPSSTRYAAGSLMYDFTVTTIKGETLTLSEILKTKKGVLLNFWATWCGPCENEFPAIEKLYGEFKNDIEVIALDQDPTETTAQIEAYVASHGLTFHVTSDTLNLYGRFNKKGIPTSVFIDSEGYVTDIIEGVSPDLDEHEARFRAIFEKLSGRSAQTTSLEALLPVKDED